MSNYTFIPLTIKPSPIKKLALLPIEKDLDTVYRGFELQYIDDRKANKGYRILAYRIDKHVDVYDDMSLKFDPEEQFNVVENGCNRHIQTNIERTRFENIHGKEILSFSFIDVMQRQVNVVVEENNNTKTIPMNLLAPIGLGAVNPTSLLLFYMYDFDFIRKKNTKITYTIDGKEHKMDQFPIPMQHQKRYFARYSEVCTLLEFAPEEATQLQQVELDEHMCYHTDECCYQFDNVDALKEIVFETKPSNIKVTFTTAFTITQAGSGTFQSEDDGKMGCLTGNYSIDVKENRVTTKLNVSQGWRAVPNSLITKIILSKKSVFSTWPRGYTLTQQIDLATGTVIQKWTNVNGGKE